jgi:hypothetical protein
MLNTLRIIGLLLITMVSENWAAAQARLATPPYPAANLWMTYPVPWSPASDTLPMPVRQQRDQYFDGLIGLPASITPENMRSTGFGEGVSLSTLEIPNVPNRSIVIGTFASYHPVLSRSGRSIYTEVVLSLSHVFEDSGGNLPGSAIVLILPGGTVSTPAAELSFLTQPRQYFIKPGSTYLLVMSFHRDGTFYMLAKDWDLTSGIVQRNSPAPKTAPSTLVGLTTQQLITRLVAQLQ